MSPPLSPIIPTLYVPDIYPPSALSPSSDVMPSTPPPWADHYSPVLYTASSSMLPSPSVIATRPSIPTVTFPESDTTREMRAAGTALANSLDAAVSREAQAPRPSVRTAFEQPALRQSAAAFFLDTPLEPQSAASLYAPSDIEVTVSQPVSQRTPPQAQPQSHAPAQEPAAYPPLPPSTSSSLSPSPSPSLRISPASPRPHSPSSPASSASSLGSPNKALDNSLLRERVDLSLHRLSGGWWSPVVPPGAGFTLPTGKPGWVAQQRIEEATHRATPPVERLRRILGEENAGTPLSPVAEGTAEESEGRGREEGPLERGRRARSTGDLTRLITQPKPKPRHSQFYMREEMVVFNVQGLLYRVHRHHLEHDSAYFRRLFLSRGTSEHGRTDETAIQLNQVTSEEFDCLLSYIYNGIFEPELLAIPDWTALLRVSTALRFNKIRMHAIRALSAALDALSPVEALVLAAAHDVPEWLAPGYAALVRRATPLEDDEAEMLGARVTARVARARERVGDEVRRLRRRSGAPAGEEEWEEVVQRVVGEVFWPESAVAV